MKGLNKFMNFDLQGFLEGKTLVLADIKPRFVYEDGKRTSKRNGTTLVVVIVEDNTDYGDYSVRNRFESFNVNVIDDDDFSLELDSSILLKDYVSANVYGTYRNKLSVQCTKDQVVDKNAVEG